MRKPGHGIDPRVLFSRRLTHLLFVTGLLLLLAGDTAAVIPAALVPRSTAQQATTVLSVPAAPAVSLPGDTANNLAASAGSDALQAMQAPAPLGATTEDYVNMRSGPGTSYAILAQLPADMRAQVLGTRAGWYHILTPWNSEGWVVGDYFKLASQADVAQIPVLGTGANIGVVNLRAGPGTNYPSYGLLADSTLLDVLAFDGDWYKVRSPRGTIGWVAMEYTALDWIPDVYGGSGPPSTAANDVVSIAQRYLGARYVWGGSDPSGFDCSGLTWYVYRKVGVRLPGGSAQQFSTRYGRFIRNIKSLAPGDLVFFENTTEEAGITHIGIYAGDNKMIAARSERLGVRYVSLLEPFWSSRFVGGIRPYR